MQLLLQRKQGATMFGRPAFKLWAKFELTDEERSLIAKYQVRDFLLTEGNTIRDLIRAVGWAVVFAFALFIFLTALLGFFPAMRYTPVVFLGSIYFIYHHIREQIRVSDVLDGRFFTCRSVIKLAAREQIMTNMAIVFCRFLEAMKTWGGNEIIEMDPHNLPTVHLIGPSDALS